MRKMSCSLVSEARYNPDCYGGQQPTAAVQIAKVLNKIPHKKYVEPFLGMGSVYKRTLQHEKAIINDIDCRRLSVAKKRICSTADKTHCNRIKNNDGVSASCGRDWKAIVRQHDGKDVLMYFDPPYEQTLSGKGTKILEYKHNDVPFSDVVAVARKLKGKVAISYSNIPRFRKELCKKPFRCKRIKKYSLAGKPYHELLAVKS